ncbi:MAG: ribosome biogenesis GTPase Der [Candidatus Azosocius agrarius]|nr:MAG: ribosome biogenesis GTPase Der [Gammaproteobacteria bacterium]
MLPVVSLVGRPNVGKSTLFNLLTCSFNAIVLDVFGTTRDRQYGIGIIGNFSYLLIDTGGIVIENDSKTDIFVNVLYQIEEAIKESNIVLFIIDLKFGLLEEDILISNYLRKFNKNVILIVNKIDLSINENFYLDIYSLGFGHPILISAKYNKNILKLANKFLSIISESKKYFNEQIYDFNKSIKIAVIGKPNVGKSTLINSILKKNRLVVFNKPGTTRDSVYIPFKKKKDYYIFVDTAGLRKKKNVLKQIEKFSVIRCIRAIKYCNVVLLLVDIVEGITEQDIKLMKLVVDIGKCLLLIFSKCDKSKINRTMYISKLKYNIPFFNIIIVHFISSYFNIGVNRLFFYINLSYDCANKKISSYFLNKLLENLKFKYETFWNKKKIQFKYIHCGGHNPIVFVIHGNNFDKIIDSHKKYLINWFIEKLKLVGTPIFVIFKLK